MTAPRCPVGCSGANLYLEASGYTFFKCPNCGLVFVSPQPTNSDLVKIYTYEQKSGNFEKLVNRLNPGLALVLKSELLMKVLNHWSRSVTTDRVRSTLTWQKKGTVLDIGCGPGFFLKEMKNQGFEIWGTEIGDKLVTIAKKNTESTNILKGEITELKFPAAETITFWHVLEHVSNFDATIDAVVKGLKKQGTLIIEVPHGESLNFKLFKANWTLLLVPQHLFLWTKRSLAIMLGKKGLKIERIEFPDHFPFVFLSSLVKANRLFVYLTPLFLPLSMLVSLVINIMHQGDVIRVYAKKAI